MAEGKFVIFNRGRAPYVLPSVTKGGKTRTLLPGGSIEVETEDEFKKLLRYKVLVDAKKVVPAQADAMDALHATIADLKKENASLKAAKGDDDTEPAGKGKGKGSR